MKSEIIIGFQQLNESLILGNKSGSKSSQLYRKRNKFQSNPSLLRLYNPTIIVPIFQHSPST